MTSSDYVQEFRLAMEMAGLTFSGEIVPNTDGFQRVHLEGDKAGSINGWYRVFIDDHPAGVFGSWKTGEKHVWHSKHGLPMTAEQRQEWDKQIQEMQRTRERDQERLASEAAEKARFIWEMAWPAPKDHPYLLAKGVGPHDLRLYRRALVVPMRDLEGTIHSLHFIQSDGKKEFLHDGRIRGCFHFLGQPSMDKKIWIAEGFATAASIYELTRDPVAITCMADNLKRVALVMHKFRPHAEIVLAADNDRTTDENPGLTKAMEAARSVDGKVSVPWFFDTSTRPSDWNDARKLHGEELTRRALLGSVMTPEQYRQRTRERDLTWARHARDTGWSERTIQRGLELRNRERGFERSIGHER